MKRWLGLIGVLAIGFLVVLLLSRGGLIDGPAGRVSGTITVTGRPLVEGVITFQPHDPRAAIAGATVENGRYSVGGVPVGDCAITIKGSGVPARYSSKATSGLTVSIQRGDNVVGFDLP